MKLLFLASIVLSNPIQNVPQSKDVKIDSVTFFGNGCPKNSASIALSEDSTIGTGSSSKDAKKSCMIDVLLSYPQNWTFTVSKVDYRGFISVPVDTSATLSIKQEFFNGKKALTASKTFNGPFTDDYIFSKTNTDTKAYCSKNQPMRITTSLELKGKTRENAQITIDSLDQSISQKLAIQWYACQ
jgi:hypothetical protein